jgi:RNA polymerase sigma factor (sigma-70 family)
MSRRTALTSTETLLTAEQETALARRMRGEDVTVPGPGESRPTSTAAHARLVEQNLRLVAWLANRHRDRGVPVEDLIQEGALGLHRAAEKFDPDRGFRFATYATWWIRQAMIRALMTDGRIIRLRGDLFARIGRVRETEQKLGVDLGRSPSSDELAHALSITSSELGELLRAAHQTVSLDLPLDEDGNTVGDVIADQGMSPIEHVERQALGVEVRQALAGLLPAEREVVTLRYGFDHAHPLTTAEVAQRLGISRPRVARLEASALARMRGDRTVRGLLTYVA